MLTPCTTRCASVAATAVLVACGDTSPGIESTSRQTDADAVATQGPDSNRGRDFYTVPAEGGIWRGTDSEGHDLVLMASPNASMTRFADFTLGFAGDGLEDGYAYDDEANISGYGFWAFHRPPTWPDMVGACAC